MFLQLSAHVHSRVAFLCGFFCSCASHHPFLFICLSCDSCRSFSTALFIAAWLFRFRSPRTSPFHSAALFLSRWPTAFFDRARAFSLYFARICMFLPQCVNIVFLFAICAPPVLLYVFYLSHLFPSPCVPLRLPTPPVSSYVSLSFRVPLPTFLRVFSAPPCKFSRFFSALYASPCFTRFI